MRIGISKFAKDLRNNPPASEIWFYDRARHHGFIFWENEGLMRGWDDKLNKPLYGIYIPDFYNLKCKFVVEIDGSIHDLAKQKEKDRKKDAAYARWGFEVFRIPAYDEGKLVSVIDSIERIRVRRLPGINKKIRNKLIITLGWKPIAYGQTQIQPNAVPKADLPNQPQ